MKATKVWLIIASALVIVGILVFTVAVFSIKGNFKEFETMEYETKTHSISENFTNISINSDTADIEFIPSESGKCEVICFEAKNLFHSVSVDENTLVIKSEDQRRWYEFLSFSFKTPKITVYLPYFELSALSITESTGDIKIPKDFSFKTLEITASTGDILSLAATDSAKFKTDTGSITLRDTSAKNLNISVSTGKVSLTDTVCDGNIEIKVSTGGAILQNITCQSLSSYGDTGDITLNNVIASEKFQIKRSTGQVKFESSDAAEIFIQTDTGNVSGSLLSDKIFIAESDTGRVDLPKTITGGRCEITTDTGNIKITIAK